MSQCLAAYGAAAMCDALPVLMLPQELQIQLKHACAPAEQLLKQARAAGQAAAVREARLEEQGREQAELAARQATQALQALRAQQTAAHAEALLEVSLQSEFAIIAKGAQPLSIVPHAHQGVCRTTGMNAHPAECRCVASTRRSAPRSAATWPLLTQRRTS